MKEGPQFADDLSANFEFGQLDPEKTSVIVLYARDEKGDLAGRLITIPFEQRPLDETLRPSLIPGGKPTKCGNIYDIEVTDPELRAVLCQS